MALTNYNCNSATSITLGSYAFNNTDADANVHTFCGTSRNFLWYSYTNNAATTQFIQASTAQNSTFDVVLAAYTECSDFPGNYLTCSPQSQAINFPVPSGQTYYIALSGLISYENFTGTGNLTLSQIEYGITVLTPSFYNLVGSVIEYILNSTGVTPVPAQLALICNSQDLLRAGTFSSDEIQYLTLPATPPGNCTLMAGDDLYNPTSYTASNEFISYGLVISQPVSNQQIFDESNFEISITSNAVNNTDWALVTFYCYDANNYTATFNVTTNTPFLTAQLDPEAWGTCYVSAESALMTSFTSIAVVANTPLTISVPENNSIISIGESNPFLVSAISITTGQLAAVNFVSCSINGYASFPVYVNVAALISIPYWFAGDTCQVMANGTYFTDSPTIEVSFWNPLSLSPQTALTGWKGGEAVSVQVNALSERVETYYLRISCPTQQYTDPRALNTGQMESVLLPESLSGIGCLLETVGVAALVQAMQPVSVNIDLGTVASAAVLNRLQLLMFVP